MSLRDVPGWEEAPLDAIGHLYCGQSPATADVNTRGEGVPYVSGPDHWDGSSLAITKWTTKPKRLVPDGCVFVTVKGAGVGKVFPGVPCAIGRDIYAFEPAGGVSARFVEHRLRFEVAEIVRKASGDIPGLSKDDILSHSALIPPAAEQDRIVAAIEQHLSRVEAGVEALVRVKRELARYRGSVLKAACEGRLVPTEAALARAEGRDYEPASALLERILAERRARWDRKRKSVEPAAPDETSLPAVPVGWKWATLGQLTGIQGGVQKQPSREPKTNAYPFLRVANVKRGCLDLDEIHRIELRDGELEKLRLELGDLLIVEGNGSAFEIGRMAVWNGAINDCVHQNHIIRARPYQAIAAGYASAYWNSPDGSRRVFAVASSTSGLFTLSVGKISVLPVPLPPLAEQHRIVAEVERRLSIADEVAASVEASLARAARLRQSILKRAFEGKLVPQDPNDEPASALLARTRAERERTVTPKPKRTKRASARRV